MINDRFYQLLSVFNYKDSLDLENRLVPPFSSLDQGCRELFANLF